MTQPDWRAPVVDGLEEGVSYIGWLREHGLVWFEIKRLNPNTMEVGFVQPQWRSTDQAQAVRRVFEDRDALRTAVLTDSSWWSQVEGLRRVDMPSTWISYDQMGWWTPQPWIKERLLG